MKALKILTPPRVSSQAEAAIQYVAGLDVKTKDWSIGTGGMREMLRMLYTASPYSFENRKMRVLEIGTCRSLTSILFASLGTVYTLDVKYYPETEAILEGAPAGTRSNIVGIVAGDANKARKMVCAMHHIFDAVFIDGCHTLEAVVRDITFAREHAKSLIFHDYNEEHKSNVVMAVDAFRLSVPTVAFAKSETTCLAMTRDEG